MVESLEDVEREESDCKYFREGAVLWIFVAGLFAGFSVYGAYVGPILYRLSIGWGCNEQAGALLTFTFIVSSYIIFTGLLFYLIATAGLRNYQSRKLIAKVRE